MGPLDGIRVVEIANFVAGPYAAALLGDLGAEVVKIEPPPHGDPFRGWDSGNYSPTFCSVNRNKRSIVLDLRTEQGLAVARSLIDRADVLVENARVGALARRGLDYESLSRTNPRLVYCAISGFGPSGPYAARPGFDTVGQAMSGLMSLLTDVEAPRGAGLSLSDHLGGQFGAYGVLAALLARERSGLGQRVDTSLLQASVAFLSENMTRYLATDQVPLRDTRVRTAQVYAFTDQRGAPFVIHMSSQVKSFLGVLEVVGRSELAEDPRFASRAGRQHNHHELQAILQSAFETAPRDHWLALLEAEDVPCAPLNTLDEVVADPQVQHLGMVQEVAHPQEGPMRVLGSGVIFSATPTTLSAAPVLDEHRAEILAELGLPADYLQEPDGQGKLE